MEPINSSVAMPIVRILVVEDEEDFRRALIDLFRLEGYLPVGVASISEYVSLISDGIEFDLVVLDRHLPDGDGLDILVSLRKISECPVVILTGAGASSEKVRGFEADADHYLVKPVDTEELLAIIRKLTRSRQSSFASAKDWGLNKVTWNLVDPMGHEIKLTKNELSFLGCFVGRSGQTIMRDTIVTELGHKTDVYDFRRLEVLVRRLRMKLKKETSEEFPISTVYGSGYAINAHLNELGLSVVP